MHTRARDQCYNAIRRAIVATEGRENVQVMLHLSTVNGAVLLEMVATVVRTESKVVAILTGREVDSALAGLLHTAGSVTESDADIRASETDISSITLPSGLPLLVGRGGNSTKSHDADEESIEPTPNRRPPQQAPPTPWARSPIEYQQAYAAPLLQRSRAEEQSHWDSDSDGTTRARESRRMRFGFSDTSSRDSNLKELRFRRRNSRAIERQRYALRAACSTLRAVGAFIWNGRNKNKRMLAMWLNTNQNMNLDVVRRIGEYCWKDGWRGVAGGVGDIRMAAVEAEAAAAAAATRLAFRLGGASAAEAEAEAEAQAAHELAELERANDAADALD